MKRADKLRVLRERLRLAEQRYDDLQDQLDTTIEPSVTISAQLLNDMGIVPGHRRYPSIDEIIMSELLQAYLQ